MAALVEVSTIAARVSTSPADDIADHLYTCIYIYVSLSIHIYIYIVLAFLEYDHMNNNYMITYVVYVRFPTAKNPATPRPTAQHAKREVNASHYTVVWCSMA